MAELRNALRSLRSAPLLSATVVLTLGLGIGATTAVFSVVDRVLIKPLPYPDSGALVRIVHSIGGVDQPYFSDAIYLAYVDNAQAFQDVGVWVPGERVAITGQGDPEEVHTLTASRGLGTTLGVSPAIGRWFSAADDTPGASDTVIITSGYWNRRFAGDPAVLERGLTVNGRSTQIIGVMPPEFRFDSDFEIVLPLRIDRGAPTPGFRLLGVARLRPGVTLAQANADVARLFPIWVRNPTVRARWAPALRPVKQDVVGDISRTLWVLLGAIGVALAMACANVANLLLVRGNIRRQEFAVRIALGASWARIARQLLTESLALASVGGALGVAAAYGGLRLLLTIAPSNLPRLHEISIDAAALLFAVALSLLSGVLFALVPILKHSGPRLVEGLGGSGRSLSLTPERARSQEVLVTAQVALALVLLLSAGLMIRSFQTLRSVAPGFADPEHIQTFTMSIPATMVAEPERVTRMQDEVLQKIAAIPSVVSVAFTTRVPMGSDRSSTALSVEGFPDDGQTPPNRQVKIVSPGFFRTLDIALVQGHDFTWTDVYDKRPVAIISENLAREVFGSAAAALGKRVREYYDNAAPWLEIVGVADDVNDDGADQPAPKTIYWPAQPDDRLLSMSAYQSRRVTFAVRTHLAGTLELLRQVRDAVWSVSSTLPPAQLRTLDELYAQSMARTSFTLVMLAIGATMALLLGISGVYGMVAYAVSRRRREVGIRLALGAQPADIRSLFMRRGLVLVAIGVGIGLSVAAGGTRLMQALLFGIDPLDPITFAATSVVLVGAATVATYLAARRAMAIDPVETLRTE